MPTLLDTNYVYKSDEQTISKRDISERDGETVRCYKCCEYTTTMERSRPDDVHMAAPCWVVRDRASVYRASRDTKPPNWPQNSPDVKRRTDAATMKQISERKRKYPNRREKNDFWIGFVPWRKR